MDAASFSETLVNFYQTKRRCNPDDSHLHKNICSFISMHHGMARPQVADGGERLQIWRVAANILNKQSRTADKGWPSSLGVGRGANNSPP
jgi:hypothetical protein